MSILHFRGRNGAAKGRTVFVLGGGGNLGAIQVGMLRAVLERGIVPDALVGCSAGAINAAAIAADPTPQGAYRLKDIWMALPDGVIASHGKLSPLRFLTHRGPAMQASDGLRRLLEANLPWRTFEEWPTPFEVVATSLRTGRERWLATGPVVPALLASAALPGVFPPIEHDGDLLTDGGVVNNVPISRAVEHRPSRIVVFHVGNFERSRPAPRRPIDVLVQAFSIARNARFVRESDLEQGGTELVVLPSVDPGSLRYDDFRQSPHLIERGYAAAATYLDTAGRTVAGGV